MYKDSMTNVRESLGRMRHRKKLIGLAFAASLLLGVSVLSGCATGPNSDGTADISRLNLPDKNKDQWVMPLDQYTIGDTSNSDYAENLLVGKCMEQSGFSWKVPWRDINATDGPSWNEARVYLFNVGLATNWGYHLAPALDASLAAWNAFVRERSVLSTAAEEAVTDCIFKARDTLPVLPGSAQVASSHALTAWLGAQEDEVVRAAASKWSACMTPLGISDLPSNPQEMPSPSLVERFDIAPVVSATPPNVTLAEIAIATSDAKCREESGYRDAFYEEEWDRQVALLADNADALERVKSQLVTHRAKVLEVISSNAPSE